MQAVGIIAEYNPFHNGHQWHLEKAKELSGCDVAVAVMSGNFVQRGEPALFDKWARAEMAVRAGVDLVFELPAVFAVRSAQFFASGAVRLLNSLGIVGSICFGAEEPDLHSLAALAAAVDDARTVDMLKRELNAGQSYAKALGLALASRSAVPADTIAAPNNILAIEYLRAIAKFAPSLQPLVIPRRQAGYHDTVIAGSIASATAIRHCLQDQPCWRTIGAAVPPASAGLMRSLTEQGRGPVFFEEFGQILLAGLRAASLAELELLPDINEGLHLKIKKSSLQAASLPELIEKVKSKRYARTRLQRLLIHFLLGITKEQLRSFDTAGPLYGRVLAFNNRGRKLLRRLTGAAVPIITKTTHYLNSDRRDQHSLTPLQAMLAVDTFASDIYALAMASPSWRRGGADFRTTPLYIAPAKQPPDFGQSGLHRRFP